MLISRFWSLNFPFLECGANKAHPEDLLRVSWGKNRLTQARAFCDSGQLEPVEAVVVTVRGLESAGHIHHSLCSLVGSAVSRAAKSHVHIPAQSSREHRPAYLVTNLDLDLYEANVYGLSLTWGEHIYLLLQKY